MGFLKPDLPQIDVAEWSKGTRSEKIRPMAQHWAEVGFGTPVVMHLFYVVKILLYILGGWLFAALATRGIDGLAYATSWYAEPIVFQKVVLYTMLFEVIGLGCGFGRRIGPSSCCARAGKAAAVNTTAIAQTAIVLPRILSSNLSCPPRLLS